MITKKIEVQSVELTPEQANIVAKRFTENTKPFNKDEAIHMVREVFDNDALMQEGYDPLNELIEGLKQVQFTTTCKQYLDNQKEKK